MSKARTMNNRRLFSDQKTHEDQDTEGYVPRQIWSPNVLGYISEGFGWIPIKFHAW